MKTDDRIYAAIAEAKEAGVLKMNLMESLPVLKRIAEKHKIKGLLKNDDKTLIGWTDKHRVTF